MSFRRRLKNKKIPAGFDQIEEVIEDFEQQIREAVNEDHQGKRKNEGLWKLHRLHWEKNRFIYDLMYVRKVMSKELYDFLAREKIADGALISKWRKPGYEILCSMLAIQKGAHNFGTTSLCRVPMKNRSSQQKISPDVQTGCICCASGDGRFGGPIWWNTPMDDDDDGGKEKLEENRTVWVQDTGDGDDGRENDDFHPKTAEEEEQDDDDDVGPMPPPPPAGEEEDDDDEQRGGSRKRPYKEIAVQSDEDELDDDVKKRLAILRGSA